MSRLPWLVLACTLVAPPTLAQQSPPGQMMLERTDEGEAGEPAPDVNEAERARQAAALANDPDVVREVETLLKEEGYLAANPDGRFDDQTRDAVSRFQRSRAIHITGEMDFDTLAALGVISGEGDDLGSAEQAADAVKREPQSSQVPKPDVMPQFDTAPPDQPGRGAPQ